MAEVNALKPGDPGYVPTFNIIVGGYQTDIKGRGGGRLYTTPTGPIFVGDPLAAAGVSVGDIGRINWQYGASADPNYYINILRWEAQQRAQEEAARKAEQEARVVLPSVQAPPVVSGKQTFTPTKEEQVKMYGERPETIRYVDERGRVVSVERRVGFGPTGYDPIQARAERAREEAYASPLGFVIGPAASYGEAARKFRTGYREGDIGGQLADIAKTDVPIVSGFYQAGKAVAKGRPAEAVGFLPIAGTAQRAALAGMRGDVTMAGMSAASLGAELAFLGVGVRGVKPKVTTAGIGRYVETPKISAFDVGLVTKVKGITRTKTFVSRAKGVVEAPKAEMAPTTGIAEVVTARLRGGRYVKAPKTAYQFTIAKPLMKTETMSLDVLGGAVGKTKVKAGFAGLAQTQKIMPSETLFGKALVAARTKPGMPAIKSQIKTILFKQPAKAPPIGTSFLQFRATDVAGVAAQRAAAETISGLAKTGQIKPTPVPTMLPSMRPVSAPTRTATIPKTMQLPVPYVAMKPVARLPEETLSFAPVPKMQAARVSFRPMFDVSQAQRQMGRMAERKADIISIRAPAVSLSEAMGTEITTRQTQRQLQRQMQKQKQLQRQMQRQMTKTASVTTAPAVAPPFLFGFGAPGFRLPKIKFPSVKSVGKGRKPKYKYQPSVAGIFRYEWGGRRYYATKTPRSIATELRPIIIAKRRRR